MKEYIETEEAIQIIEALENAVRECAVSPSRSEEKVQALLLHMETLRAYLKTTPGADVIESGRCKDCAYWEREKPLRSVGRCRAWFYQTRRSSDYCSEWMQAEQNGGGQNVDNSSEV